MQRYQVVFHTKSDLKVHAAWIPKYRKRVLSGSVAIRTRDVLHQIVLEHEIDIFIYTPKHGSWFNAAEIELNVMIRQCLSRRIDSITEIKTEVLAWQDHRDQLQAKVNWRSLRQRMHALNVNAFTRH